MVVIGGNLKAFIIFIINILINMKDIIYIIENTSMKDMYNMFLKISLKIRVNIIMIRSKKWKLEDILNYTMKSMMILIMNNQDLNFIFKILEYCYMMMQSRLVLISIWIKQQTQMNRMNAILLMNQIIIHKNAKFVR